MHKFTMLMKKKLRPVAEPILTFYFTRPKFARLQRKSCVMHMLLHQENGKKLLFLVLAFGFISVFGATQTWGKNNCYMLLQSKLTSVAFDRRLKKTSASHSSELRSYRSMISEIKYIIVTRVVGERDK